MFPNISPKQLLYKILDLVKKNKNNHYKEIKSLVEKGTNNAPQLKALLKHACTSTIFYNKFDYKKGIKAFPVINKNIIKTNYSSFQSTKFKNAKNRIVATSGSTGIPFKVHQNLIKILRNTADNLYFSELAGYNLGNKLYYFRMWNAFEKKGVIERWAMNIIPIDVFELTDNFFSSFLKKIQSNKSPKSWIGYASSFETMCKYLEKNEKEPINCNLKSVIAISESLSPYTKQTLKKYFNVNAVSRYSNVENGIIAQQLLGTSYFVLNTASYYVEILDINSDKPVELGQKGRIVITDLYNFSIPMIRYDTGDIGVMKIVDNKPVLTSIEGRKIDAITNTKGEIIANNIMLLLNNYHELNQCQLIQKNNKIYVFKINIDGEFKNERKFINDFKTYLGEDAIIKLEYVDEIPLLASGKRRVMVNETNI
ncbi:phenylacetate--CoA ligase family protein [Seonamhaeicola sp. NFXS20]|uniref:CoF synthetase n=1 Tax=Seonamhaeicola sp. NFXS20 TaxID=2816959 RepID=UPI003B8BCEE3